jgi:serine/threonine protein kinase
MEYLAKRHIVHRDLAARNVLVKNAVHVEVTDFGLAKMLPGADESVVVEGKVAAKWMAPESLRWKVFDEFTDVWSFGVTCWEILTLGGMPYKNVDLNRGCLASDLAKRLEAGLRLPLDNMSIELQQELIKCG